MCGHRMLILTGYTLCTSKQ